MTRREGRSGHGVGHESAEQPEAGHQAGAGHQATLPVGILHRDAHCVVVNKPAGMITHRGWANDDRALLQEVRDRVRGHVYPVNRLDRGASGIVVFALSPAAAGELSAAMREAEKVYLAITRGHPPEELVIDHAIPRAPGEPRVPAITAIRRLETFGRYALVECRPRTGRLHQIRRHLKHISCPLIGDVRYGKGDHNRLFRSQHGLFRLALHCSQLWLDHPGGERLHITCPLPGDLLGAIASCRTQYGTPQVAER